MVAQRRGLGPNQGLGLPESEGLGWPNQAVGALYLLHRLGPICKSETTTVSAGANPHLRELKFRRIPRGFFVETSTATMGSIQNISLTLPPVWEMVWIDSLAE